MDNPVKGSVMHRVLVLVLVVGQWRPARSAPAPLCSEVDLIRTEKVANLLQHNTNKTLNEYMKSNGVTGDPIPDDEPRSTVTGSGISEKLRDIYTDNQRFQMHIEQMTKYKLYTEKVAAELGHVKDRLHYNLLNIKKILDCLKTAVPTAPAPLQGERDDWYEQKVYGWSVLVALLDWAAQVKQVIMEAKTLCQDEKLDPDFLCGLTDRH